MADNILGAENPSAKTGDISDPARIEAKKTGWKNAFLWFSYDAADTYFSQLIISIAFTPFALVLGIYQLGWSYEKSFIIVSIFMAASNLLIAVFGPIMGALSDRMGKRKGAVIIVASIMIASSAIITAWVNFYWACIMFVIANFCYQAGRMFYDAQIPFLAETEKRSVLQAVGGSLSFFGSVFAVLTSMIAGKLLGGWEHIDTAVWEANPDYYASFTLDNFINLKWLFVIGAAVILLMSIPYLFHKEVENPPEEKTPMKDTFRRSLNDFIPTAKEIFKDRNSILFFLCWFFITDAANTAIMFMAIIIQGAVGYSAAITNYVIFAGIGGSLIFAVLTGFFMRKYGPRLTFIVNGISWAIAIIIVIFSGWQYKTEFIDNSWIVHTLPQWPMFIGAFFIGIGFGGIWIIGRQFIMVLAPPSKLAQYGGFQKIAGRVSAIVSPLLFSAMIFAFTGSIGTHHAYRIALLQLLIFFLIGVLLLFFIRDPHKRYLKGERSPYPGIYDRKSKK
ncbi:MAG: MFS transporter [Candidatus Heimdallarchaeota archaeon]|nr:MFS transporter [Candidatus Heimdallarchaeota archaeon]